MTTLTGTGVALVTPFDENGRIDYGALKKLLNHTKGHGIDYYVVGGTTGEPATLTALEKRSLLNFVKENNPGRLPVVYGIGGNNTRSLLDEITETDLSGVEAILSVSPYYNKPSQAGIHKHYEVIADYSPVPIILYNVPGRTGSNITAETTLSLSEHQNIIAIKEASGNLDQIERIAKNKAPDFALISGEDLLTVEMIKLGASGLISVLANAYADKMGEMVNRALAFDLTSAHRIKSDLKEIDKLMYEESNPVGVKYVLQQLGICKEYVRLPLVAGSLLLKERIDAAMQQIEQIHNA